MTSTCLAAAFAAHRTVGEVSSLPPLPLSCAHRGPVQPVVRRPRRPLRSFAAVCWVLVLALAAGCSPSRQSPGPPPRSALQDAEVFARMVNASWALADRSQPDVFAETLRFLLDNHGKEPYELTWDQTEELVRLDKEGDVACIAVVEPPSLSSEMDAEVIPCP
jgi:hypothetical protein